MSTLERNSALSELDKPLGYEFLNSLPDDSQRHEIILGEHFVTPARSTAHQAVLRDLLFFFYTQIHLTKRGTVFFAPVDVELTEHDIVEPDLVVILKQNEQIIAPSRILGIPDLIVEVLSPSNANHDLDRKRSLYERVGVPEYWIVDPAQRAVTQLVLKNGRYEEVAHEDETHLAILPDVVIHLREIW